MTEESGDKMLTSPLETQPLGQTLPGAPAVPMTDDKRMTTVEGGTLRLRRAPDRRQAPATELPSGERRARFR